MQVFFFSNNKYFILPALVDQSDSRPTGEQNSRSIPLGPATFLVEIDHKIFSTVILSLPLIQEGQLSHHETILI